MKQFKDFKCELNKCSKCALCQSVCPLFELSKNDCSVSKGKLIMLDGAVKGDLKLSKNINKYIDMCLRCGKCTSFCPSTIDVCQILNTAKYEYMKNKMYSSILNILYCKPVFNSALNFFGFLAKFFRPKRYKSEKPNLKVLYFKGCVNRIFPNTDKYINKIFSKSDIEIIEPDFDCCGLPFLSEGNIPRFIQAAKYNIEKFDNNYDYIVTDCASCEDTILNYSKYIEDFQINSGKSVNWGDLISYKKIKFEFENPVKITFHRPCHLKNDAFFERIIKNCTNVEYVKMENYDDCCGFAGSFVLKNSDMSRKIMKQKAQHIIDTGADYVITTCPSCILGLKYGLKLKHNKNIEVLSLLEFLSGAEKIIIP